MVSISEEAMPSYWAIAHTEHYGHLCHLACNKLTDGDMAKAEELVSEAFVRAIRYAKEEKLDNLGGYLWRIVTRVHITQWRKDQTAITDSIDDPANNGLENQLPPTEIEDDILHIIENERLLEEFNENKGPLTKREDLLLTRHLEGYSSLEIAAELDQAVSAVRTDINKVKNKVYYRLKQARGKKTRDGLAQGNTRLNTNVRSSLKPRTGTDES